MRNIWGHLSASLKFQRENPMVSAAIWSAALAVCTVLVIPMSVGDLLPLCVSTTLLTMQTHFVLLSYLKSFEARVSAPDGGPVWEVSVNDVLVGAIRDADYAKVRIDVLLDESVYINQLGYCALVVYRGLNMILTAVPILVVWGAIGLYFFRPEYFQLLLAADTTHPLKLGVSAAEAIGYALFSAFVGGFIYHVIFGNPFGFVNAFTEEVENRVRKAVKCPGLGQVSLFRIVDGDVITPGRQARSVA